MWGSELRAEISCTKCRIVIQVDLSCLTRPSVDRKTIDNQNLDECWNKKRRLKRRFLFGLVRSVSLDTFNLNRQFDFRCEARQAIGQTKIAAIEHAVSICATHFFFEHRMHDALK